MTRCRVPRDAAGVTLVELLVATALMLAVSGAALTLLARLRMVFDAQPEAADVQQRLRVAHDALYGDLVRAGGGPVSGPLAGALTRVLPPLVPYRRGQVGDDAAAWVFYRPGAVSLATLPSRTAIAAVTGVAGGVVSLQPNCGSGPLDRVCGFTEGMRVVIADVAGRYDFATVTGVTGAQLQLAHAGAWASSYSREPAIVAEVELRTYYLRAGDGAPPQLVSYDGFLTDRPVVDHVAALEVELYGTPEPPRPIAGATGGGRVRTTYGPAPPEAGVDDPDDTWGAGENCVFARAGGEVVARLPVLAAGPALVRLAPADLQDGPWCPDASTARYDADLLRVRRAHIRLRIQAAAAMVRGPAGRWFATGGTGREALRLVPDLSVAFDVTPRALQGAR